MDRDGEPFETILSFLRTGQLFLEPDEIPRLQVECDFYGITSLLENLAAQEEGEPTGLRFDDEG